MPILPTLSCTRASGGSPASRERMMRSWRISKALTIEVTRPGAEASALASARDQTAPPRHQRAITPLLSPAGSLAAAGGSERARDADRHRIDDRAVEQPASVDLDRIKYAGQRVGSADRLDQGAAPEPDFMPVADFGRDAGETDRQIFDLNSAERRLEPRAQPLAADEAAAGERKIKEAEHPPPGQRTGEALQH